ncbi:hypothetical protein K458DRAFT_456173 [Lentithecium fluviatile CBS 122367]|uniref:Nephrocystin 3-like N-terminal domain-containing protein n=1 Tax=Lentithecium fluviatile CBS 122367 TaxID=1168545 RepID=A0A6G1IVL9_9PLEO|nr:hypothetical protein K458DRAFT_456173 [Lentithecium fluviatile CBS 122367]
MSQSSTSPPGSGMTFLASYVVSLLESKIADGFGPWRGVAAGFFFFVKDDTDCRIGGFLQALRDIAWQITRFDSEYADHISTYCRSWADIETLPSARRKLFTSYFRTPSRSLYLVLGGMDEAEEDGEFGHRNFLNLISDIQGPLRVNINLLLLGSPHLTNPIRLALYGRQTKMATINIEAHKNRADLRCYVERGIGRLQLEGASADLETNIRDTLEKKAQGMIFTDHRTRHSRSSSDSPSTYSRSHPRSIEGYSSTLKGSKPKDFNMMLAWISCAAKPLTLAELDAALRRNSPTGSRVLSLETKLREKFGSLITLLRDDGLPIGMLQSRTQQPATCQDVFVGPGTAGRYEVAVALRAYATEHWFIHMEACISLPPLISPVHRGKAIERLHSFLNSTDALLEWCRDTPLSFFTQETTQSISQWPQVWSQDPGMRLDSKMETWIADCKTKPEMVFLPAAKIYALEGLHGEHWAPKPALSALAQIRALNEDDDTLDTLPDPVPLQTILTAVKWASLEEAAAWHRKLAVCLRNLRYVNEAIPHFETAVRMDPYYTKTRGGLAQLYHEKRYFSKVIELELVNASVLVKRLKCDNVEESRYSEAIALLKLMESKMDETKGRNRLTACILVATFPGEGPDEFFTIVTDAAMKEDCLSWLINTYETATSSTKKHVTVVYLKLSLVQINRNLTRYYQSAEPFIDRLMEIACLDEENRLLELERCKSLAGQDYARICVRKAAAAGLGRQKWSELFTIFEIFVGPLSSS